MAHFNYLIIGGGQVSDNAARAIRTHDSEGSIGILSADVDEPYSRPALSKRLWTDPDFTVDQVPLKTAEDTGAQVLTETVATSIDAKEKSVTTTSNETFTYDKLLLATGSIPTEIEAPDDERVMFFRDLTHYRTLRDHAVNGAEIVVVGGGYIGNEIAAALAGQGLQRVKLVFPGKLLNEDRFPRQLAETYTELFTDQGVELVSGRRAEKVVKNGERLSVVLDDGSELDADVVAIGLGSKPELELARSAGLEINEGVVVNEQFATSDPSIWAAGDIAEYPDQILGTVRIAHIDHARNSGDVVGAAMAGAAETYTHTPYFYSQVFGKRWEAVGTLDPSLEMIEVPLDNEREVVYYLDGDTVVGVLLWQVSDALDDARAVLADGTVDRNELRARIS